MNFFKIKRNIVLLLIAIVAYIISNIVAVLFDLSLTQGWFSYIAVGTILIPIIISLFLYSRDIKMIKWKQSKTIKIIAIFLSVVYVLLLIHFCFEMLLGINWFQESF